VKNLVHESAGIDFDAGSVFVRHLLFVDITKVLNNVRLFEGVVHCQLMTRTQDIVQSITLTSFEKKQSA